MMAGDQSNSQNEIHQLSQDIAALLANTLLPDPSVRKMAEDNLVKLETSNKLYGLATLYITRRQDLPDEVQISAAIAFKNFIRRNWPYDPNDETSDQVDRIDAQQRELIKQHIIKFMLESPNHTQRQLSEAITIIGQNDFPEKWPSLIQDLQSFLTAFNCEQQDFKSMYGFLQTAHSIFRRYRYELQSTRLWTEIKLVIEHIAQPLTDRFKDLVMASKVVGSDTTKLTSLYGSLLLCTQIYHSLIVQDLPEFFENQIHDWLPLFLELLNVDKVPNVPQVIEEMKSEICEIASLFVQRYSDADNHKEYTQKFAQNIWNLLVTTGQDVQDDALVSSAIRYLVTVAERPESKSMFQDANVLNLLCQRVIIPNLTLRDVDEELFEDNADDYVRKDIEGSDIDTRRRAACDLVRALSKFHEFQLIEIFGRYIEEMLKSYEANRAVNWRHKDLAIFLYSAMAIKGSTRQHGTISISQHVNIVKFLDDTITCELLRQDQNQGSQILKADCLRYITTFRNHIPLNRLIAVLPMVVKLITSNNVVVRTYASITLETLLTRRNVSQPNLTAFKPEEFEPFLGELVKTLFDALDMPDSPENEYIMKAIMRLFSFSKSNLIIQFLPVVVPKMTTKLGVVAKNPKKPYFNHYLFETLALTIRAACCQNDQSIRDEFESVLFSIFEVVVNQDVQEFTPYVLQLLNLILQSQPVNAVSDRFKGFFQEVLAPTLWEKPANSKPLTELMHTYVRKMGQFIIEQNKLIPLLGIFQKLIASRATDHDALALLQTMIIHMPPAEIDARIRDIFMLIFQRLTGSKTTKLVKNVLVCFSLYALLRGADLLASAVNQLQEKIFGMVVEKLYIVDVKKIEGQIERRICICGIIKILAALPLIDNGAYNHLFAPLLMVLMEIFELPPEKNNDEDDHFIDIAESLDFQAQYSKLNYATRIRDDPTRDVGDLKTMLAVSLSHLSTKLPGFLPKILQENLDQNVVACLMKYCQAANVSIS